MAMVIQNNMAAIDAVNQLNRNSGDLAKSLAEVSSGMKIHGAGDDASGYAISERMRVMIRSLDQNVQNVQNGSALLKVAAGGIENIVDELGSLKVLALNSANDTNTDADRATLQKEFDQRSANIDNIAATTNYNGKILLDGRYGKQEEAITVTSGTSATAIPAPAPAVSTGVVEPTGSVTTISAGNYTISSNGVYELAAGYTGTVTIASGVQDVKIQQANPSTRLSDVYIEGPATGNANLWIEGLNVGNTQNKSAISFQGAGNVLTLKESNAIVQTGAMVSEAIVHIGNGLTIEGNGGGSLEINTTAVPQNGASIGTDQGETTSNANLTINSGTFKIYSKVGGGAMIGSGARSSIGDIVINGGTFDLLVNTGAGACIGSGYGSGYSRATAGNINIQNAVIRAEGDDGACIGTGIQSACGDIVIHNSKVEAYDVIHSGGSRSSPGAQSGSGAGIGGGMQGSIVGNITITESDITATSEWGAGIGSGADYRNAPCTVGDIMIDTASVIRASSTHAEGIGKGYNSTAGTVTIGGVSGQNTSHQVVWKGTPLIIHTGAKANQAQRCYIEDMDMAAMGLTDVSVTTRQKASDAIDQLDNALEYALNEATTVGAYMSRLSYTKTNLVTASENVQSAESTLRDSDMAKAMVLYARSNLLLQTSQSMLAQANQNGSSVLALLQ